MDPYFEIIEFSEFQKAMINLWGSVSSPENIRPVRKSYGNIRYGGQDAMDRMLVFPIAGFVGERAVSWASCTNISDTVVSLHGLYVDPDFRGHGLVHKMIDFALGLWPRPWSRCVGWFRDGNVNLFMSHGWAPMPGYLPRAVRLRDRKSAPYKAHLLYRDFNG